jgi:hypothetical protein
MSLNKLDIQQEQQSIDPNLLKKSLGDKDINSPIHDAEVGLNL